MKKIIMLFIISVITLTCAMPSSAKSTIYSTTTATVKDVNGKSNTLKVEQTGHKGDGAWEYNRYKLYVKKSGASYKYQKQIQDPYFKNKNNTSCGHSSDSYVAVTSQASSPSLITHQLSYCGTEGISKVYTINNGKLQEVKVPSEEIIGRLYYTGKNKLQGYYYSHRSARETYYTFTYVKSTNSLKMTSKEVY